MATGGPVEELCQELTCAICLDSFADPVTIAECGHSFCRGCLAECWQAAPAACPQCRRIGQPRNLRSNWQLANFVEITKKFSLQDRKGGDAKERFCKNHRQLRPLDLFCRTDQVLICVICDRSKEHRRHEVIPAGEVFEEYKGKIFRHLETLMTEREKILAYTAEVENESQEMLKITESEKQKTVAEFRILRQLLNEQENRLLAQVGEVEKEIARRRDEHLARLSEELSSLESLIQEMEEKHQQPVTELLLDVKSTLQRCEQKQPFENQLAFPPELKWKLRGCCDIGPFLGGVVKQFKGTLVSVRRMQKANVTLDPTTASTKLILSEDRRSIKCRSDAQDVPEKSHLYEFVLGCERFTGGCHFWGVSVGREDSWIVGVAKMSATSWSTFTPEEGVWAVGREKGRYVAFIKGVYPPLSLSGELKRIRVCLNCDGEGQLAFFDAEAGTLLYTFSRVPFFGQTLYPFFAVYDKGYLRLSSVDS